MSEPSPLFSLTCPSCSAPLEYDGHSPTIRCHFCGTIVAVPKHVRDSQTQKRPAQFSSATGIPLDLILQQVKTLLQAGKKIEAIRLYREFHDCSLKQAKNDVECMEAELKGLPPPPPFTAPPAREVSSYTMDVSRKVATKTTAAGAGGLGCVITALIFLAVGGIVLFFLFLPGGPFRSTLGIMKPFEMVSASEGSSPDVITQVYHHNDEIRMIVYLETGQKKLRWESRPFSGDEMAQLMRYSGDMVYVASESRLMALSASDGSIVWQTRLSDNCVSYEDNLFVLGGRVIVMSVDYNLQAFDAQTGNPAWSRQSQGYDAKVHLAGNRLLLLDYVLNDDTMYDLVLLNPFDGSHQLAYTPLCAADSSQYISFTQAIEIDDGIFVDDKDDSFYLVFGSSPGCVQRYDLSNGILRWETRYADGFEIYSEDSYPLDTVGSIYFNFEHSLAAVDKESGSLSILLDEQDYTFIPLAMMDGNLILRAERNVGSGGFEIWGMNPASAQVKWKYDLGKGKPLDPPEEYGNIDDDEEAWTYRTTPQGFQVIRFQGEPNQMVVETLDAAEGSVLVETIIPLKMIEGDFYSQPAILGWQGDTLWLELEIKVVGVDIAAGKVTFQWQ